MYIPDPLELLQAQMEAQADLIDENDTYPCVRCKKRVHIDDMEPVSGHPAAPLICCDCLREEHADAVFMRPEDVGDFDPEDQPAASDPNFVKHIHCEGARFHVVGWNSKGEFCSHPKCILNKQRKIADKGKI